MQDHIASKDQTRIEAQQSDAGMEETGLELDPRRGEPWGRGTMSSVWQEERRVGRKAQEQE